MWKLLAPFALLVGLVGSTVQSSHAGSDLTPPRGTALVCFYREVAFEANWFRYRVFDGPRRIGALGSGTYFNYLTTPGEHTFRSKFVVGSGTTLNLKAGRVYFVRCDPDYEVFYVRPGLEMVPPAEGAAVTAELNERLAFAPEDRFISRAVLSARHRER